MKGLILIIGGTRRRALTILLTMDLFFLFISIMWKWARSRTGRSYNYIRASFSKTKFSGEGSLFHAVSWDWRGCQLSQASVLEIPSLVVMPFKKVFRFLIASELLDGKVGTGRPSELASRTAFILWVEAWRHSFTSCAILKSIRTTDFIRQLVWATKLVRHLWRSAKLLSC